MQLLPSNTSSERLVLRQWTTDDAEALSMAIEQSVEHLRPWMGWIAHEPWSIGDIVDLIAQWHTEWLDGGDSVLGIFSSDEIVGGCGLHQRVGPDALEIGYWIRADHVRNGYATEAARALTDAGFSVAGMERIEIHHDEANKASAAVPRRLGYTLVDRTPDEVVAPGEIGINWQWVMDRADWIPT